MTEQEHLLTCLMEECAEVAQRASKAIRFGMEEVQLGQDLDNHRRLEHELGDLLGVVDLLRLTPSALSRGKKAAKIKRWMNYARERGTLD